MSSRSALALLAALFAGACAQDAGAPSDEQSREMDGAAEMLNAAPERLSEIDDRELLDGEGNDTRPPSGEQQE